MAALSIAQLREMIGTKTSKEFFAFASLTNGLPKGAITEISGAGKTEFVLQFLKEQTELKIAWIESQLSIFPFAFEQRGVSLERVLFVEGGEQSNWVALQVLKSQAFQVVVLYEEECELKTLRRMQIAAEKSAASLIWLTSKPQDAWPVGLQIKVTKRNGEIRPNILRERF